MQPLKIALLVVAAGVGAAFVARVVRSPAEFAGLEQTATTLVSDLDTPWDLSWGPDGFIWVTERGGAISRVDPESGDLTRVGELEVTEVSESGLMGLAFHPDFASRPYVYVAHSYGDDSAIRNRIVRMRYDGTSLGAPEVVLDGIPGAPNHNGSRLTFGPDGFLYITTGEASDRANAQDLASLAGKVLRITPDGDPAPGNPFGSEVFSYGHRNAQGIAFHPATGILYIAEHGPADNDEVNLIEAGGNYGWPDVRGFCDGDAGAAEDAFCSENEVVEPLTAWTPAMAVTGLDVYESDLFPEWKGSLLVTALSSRVFRLELAEDGRTIVAEEELFHKKFGRLRDVLVAPGGAIYLATSDRDGRGFVRPGDDHIIRITP